MIAVLILLVAVLPSSTCSRPGKFIVKLSFFLFNIEVLEYKLMSVLRSACVDCNTCHDCWQCLSPKPVHPAVFKIYKVKKKYFQIWNWDAKILGFLYTFVNLFMYFITVLWLQKLSYPIKVHNNYQICLMLHRVTLILIKVMVWSGLVGFLLALFHVNNISR